MTTLEEKMKDPYYIASVPMYKFPFDADGLDGSIGDKFFDNPDAFAPSPVSSPTQKAASKRVSRSISRGLNEMSIKPRAVMPAPPPRKTSMALGKRNIPVSTTSNSQQLADKRVSRSLTRGLRSSLSNKENQPNSVLTAPPARKPSFAPETRNSAELASKSHGLANECVSRPLTRGFSAALANKENQPRAVQPPPPQRKSSLAPETLNSAAKTKEYKPIAPPARKPSLAPETRTSSNASLTCNLQKKAEERVSRPLTRGFRASLSDKENQQRVAPPPQPKPSLTNGTRSMVVKKNETTLTTSTSKPTNTIRRASYMQPTFSSAQKRGDGTK